VEGISSLTDIRPPADQPALPAVALELMPGVPWASPDELNRLMRQQGLCLAVAQAAVLDEIARAISLDHQDENRLIETWLRYQNVTNDQELAEWLPRKGWSHADLRYFATKGMRLQIFKQRMFADEVELRFLERKLQLDQVTYSLIRVKEGALAQELYHRLHDDGEDFASLASTYSQGPERHSGGRIGPVPLDQAHEVVANQLRVSEPGQLWPPLFLVNIWLIIRHERLDQARLDDDVRQAMVDDLFDEWLDRRVGQLLAGERPPALPTQLLTSVSTPPEATPE
jgi:parvulin-like peptidyl-prolyl isomerase